MAIDDSARANQDQTCSVATHYYILYTLIRTGGFQLDFIAKGDVGTLDVNGFFLGNPGHLFDGYGEKKLQLTILNMVWAQHKPFHPWRASEEKVFSDISMVRPLGKRPALQTLVPIVYHMADLQGPENSDVSLTQHRSANLKKEILTCSH